MFMRSKNRISNMSSIEYRNKINDTLKLHKEFDVLIQTMQLFRTEQHIVFTIIKNFHAQNDKN